MQLVLKLAKDLYKEKQLQNNIKQTVVKATAELTMLLKSSEYKTISLKPPLYLLNDKDVLTDCSQLVVFDKSSTHCPVLPPELAYLNSLQNAPAAKHWNPKEMLELLPKELGLKSLKSIIQYKMIDSTPAYNVYSHVNAIELILRSRMFQSAIESYASYCTNSTEPPEEVTQIISDFQNKLVVQYFKEIRLRSQLNLDNKVTELQDTVFQDFFCQYHNNKIVLSLKDNPTAYSTHTFLKLSGSLCLLLKLKATRCFETVEDSGIPELTTFISTVLSCNSVGKIAYIVRESLSDIKNVQGKIDSEFILGEAIPECCHHRLDYNIFNSFAPQETVGYETEYNDIVYAQVLYCNNAKAYDEENDKRISEVKYIITIGNDTALEVTVLQLYKFVSTTLIASVSDADLHKTNNSAKVIHSQQESAREEISNKIKSIWALPEWQKQKAFKRIYIHYHPKTNPNNSNATDDFQFLLQELERVEKQQLDEPICVEQSIKDQSSFNTGWSGWFKQWDQTVSLLNEYMSIDNDERHPARLTTDPIKANTWIKQAEYDFFSLTVLMSASQTDERACASTCFMSHEVAEKSLKAGMYAKCGIDDASLKSRNIVSLARALSQMGYAINVDDTVFLENFYSHTRFPYCYVTETVPGEKYFRSTAKQAFDAATRIYEAMKNVVDKNKTC